MSDQSGCRDVSRCLGVYEMSLCRPQSTLSVALGISLPTAALRRSGGGSMFERTDSHGRGVGRKVPVINRMVVFSCTSTIFVCADRAQTRASTRQLSSRAPELKHGVHGHVHSRMSRQASSTSCSSSSVYQRFSLGVLCRSVFDPTSRVKWDQIQVMDSRRNH